MIIYVFYINNGRYLTVQDDWMIRLSEGSEYDYVLPKDVKAGDKLWIAEWFGPPDSNTVIRIEKRVP